MSKVILYTTHCPKCKVLQKKLQSKQINFDVVDDVNVMKEKGFMSSPMLTVDDQEYDFYAAVKFVNDYKN